MHLEASVLIVAAEEQSEQTVTVLPEISFITQNTKQQLFFT